MEGKGKKRKEGRETRERGERGGEREGSKCVRMGRGPSQAIRELSSEVSRWTKLLKQEKEKNNADSRGRYEPTLPMPDRSKTRRVNS